MRIKIIIFYGNFNFFFEIRFKIYNFDICFYDLDIWLLVVRIGCYSYVDGCVFWIYVWDF